MTMRTNRVLHLPTNIVLKPHIYTNNIFLNDTGKNVALHKVAINHLNTYSGHLAAYAVDGITPHYTDPDYSDKCSKAIGGSRDNHVWWRVDLEERFMITGVKIYTGHRFSKLKQFYKLISSSI